MFYRVEVRDHGPGTASRRSFSLSDPSTSAARSDRPTIPTGTQTPRQMAIAWAIEYWKAIESDDA